MTRRDFYHVETAPKANALVVAVSAVVFNDMGQIILQKRSDNGFWAIPGGGVEVGEDVSQALCREVREETGLQIRIIGLTGIYSDPKHVIAYDDGEVRQQFSICFRAEVIGGAMEKSPESTEVRAFGINELPLTQIHPAIKVRIEDCLSNQAQPFVR